MKLRSALLSLALLALPWPAGACTQPARYACDLDQNFVLGTGITSREEIVEVPTEALPLERPLTVQIAALASSEVSWNGRLIGRNGLPGASPDAEKPGRYFASFTIPAELVRPGANRLSVRMSAQHLWLPVYDPVHMVSVGLYQTPELPGRAAYLPALLSLGALLTAFIFFGLSAIGQSGRNDRQSLLLCGIALTAMIQLGLEIVRAFVDYSYPWHIPRVSAIALCAAATSIMVVAYAAERFAPRSRRATLAVAASACAMSLVFVPWFDFKAIFPLLAGYIALALSAAAGWRRGVAGSRWALAFALSAMTLVATEATAFLDQAYYIHMAAMLIALVAEQVGALRFARAAAQRAEERLRLAEEAGEPIVQLKEGARIHRVAQSDILFARGADDYCEVRLKDGRTILVTTNLARLHEALPQCLVRVHKSFGVNPSQAQSVQPRPGGGRQIRLIDGSTIPIGRSYTRIGGLK